MESLLRANELGDEEWMAWGMKRMLLLSELGDIDGVRAMLDQVADRLPDQPEHLRVFRYNRALALFKLGDNDTAVSEALALIDEYYRELGIRPSDVVGRNAPELRELLRKDEDLTDRLKHLADSHDLYAQALGRRSQRSTLARIHAMKFYELSQSYQSRSEEHTSELQSLMRISYAVFCLQKKNKELLITLQRITFVE